MQEVLKVINDQYRTNIELERVYYDTSDLVLAAVADGDVDLSALPGHSQPAPRNPYSRRQCAYYLATRTLLGWGLSPSIEALMQGLTGFANV